MCCGATSVRLIRHRCACKMVYNLMYLLLRVVTQCSAILLFIISISRIVTTWRLSQNLIQQHYSNIKLNTRMWYWVWSESSIYDFFVSVSLDRVCTLALHVLSFNSINSLLEFVFFFKITSAYSRFSNLTSIFGTKLILITFSLLITSLIVALLIA